MLAKAYYINLIINIIQYKYYKQEKSYVIETLVSTDADFQNMHLFFKQLFQTFLD